MDRRTFLYYSGATAVISAGVISVVKLKQEKIFPKFEGYEELKKELLDLNDRKIPELIKLQDRAQESEYYGGIRDDRKMFTAGAAAGFIRSLACSFSQSGSKYYRDDRLEIAMELAARYLLKMQHQDGTIDLLTTNFHSTPDTAFVVEHIWNSYQLLKPGTVSTPEDILKLLKEFLLRAGEALVTGGIHTPNHRWVVCMALSMLNHSFPDERYSRRIDQWLAEGIDIDADGQYEEKSTYIYTPLTNRCLMNISRYHNRPDLLKIMDKNLEMTLYYVHPNGEVATEASGRQDQFRVGFMEHYYFPYRTAAKRRQDERFAAMVELIEKTVPEKLLGYLPYFFLLPPEIKDIPEPAGIPDNYIREFPHSNLARIRRGNIDCTILGDNPTFFTLSKGKAVLASVRMASAFFGRGQFSSENVIRQGDSFVLKWNFKWGYFQPLPEGEKPNYELSFGVDRRRREQSELQELEAVIVISEEEGVFKLEFEVSGTDNVPLAVELAFRKGGRLSGVQRSKHEKGTFLFKEEAGTYRFGGDEIEIGGGRSEHEWTAIRGGLPKPDGDCVYVTGVTPFNHTLTFR